MERNRGREVEIEICRERGERTSKEREKGGEREIEVGKLR